MGQSSDAHGMKAPGGERPDSVSGNWENLHGSFACVSAGEGLPHDSHLRQEHNGPGKRVIVAIKRARVCRLTGMGNLRETGRYPPF